ncbi:hypothetical protein TNCV_2964401 [Trichonephila clavipes]|nr:hypothetical protein TNCV_2964401 [Trichonephila clavipes]
MFLAGHPSQGCFGLQSHCAPCYFFNQASFYPSDFSFIEKIERICLAVYCARTLPPVTIRELLLALQDEWAAMPQQLIDTLILSMGRRCETCLAVRGDHIPY